MRATLEAARDLARRYLWGIFGALWVARRRSGLLRGRRRGPAAPHGRGRPLRRPPGAGPAAALFVATGAAFGVLSGEARPGRGKPAPAAPGLVFCGRPLYHLPLLPEVAPVPDSPGGSLRPGRLLPDQRRRGAPGTLRLVRGFPPAGRGRNREKMKVILADDVRGLGHRGDTVSVKPGYARNFLFPQGCGLRGDPGQRPPAGRREEEVRREDAPREGDRQTVASKIEGMTVVIVQEGRRGRTPLRLGDGVRDRRRARRQGASRSTGAASSSPSRSAGSARTPSTSGCTATSRPTLTVEVQAATVASS